MTLRNTRVQSTAIKLCEHGATVPEQTDFQRIMRANAGRKMTPEEAFEQRVSFVFSTQDGMTKDQVREALRPAYGVPVAARTQGDKS